MNVKIETKDAFDVFGIEAICSTVGDANHITPGQLWQQSHANGEYERLFTNSGQLPSYVAKDLCKIHGAVSYRKTEPNTFPYMLCAFRSEDSNVEGYQIAHIPAHTYVILTSEPFEWDKDFSSVLSSLQTYFYHDWLPTSDYVPADSANFEIYGGTKYLGYIEVWYPVVKKN